MINYRVHGMGWDGALWRVLKYKNEFRRQFVKGQFSGNLFSQKGTRKSDNCGRQ